MSTRQYTIAGILVTSLILLTLSSVSIIEGIWPEPECVVEGGVWDEETRTCYDNGRTFRDTVFGRKYLD